MTTSETFGDATPQEIIRDTAVLIRDGLTCDQVADRCNRFGVPSPERTPVTSWTSGQVARRLRRR